MNIANKISTFRILIVPFFVACFIYYAPVREYLRFAALFIFILGALSDAADGYIARKSKLQSRAGLILDPLGDKLLLMSAFICLTFIDRFAIRFPLWVTLIVISRDIIIILGAVVIYVVKQNIEVFPTRWGKLTTTFQMIAVTIVLLQWALAPVFWWLAVIFSVISGIDYVRKGFKVLYALDSQRSTR
jgi:CDP-diacylglycerol--glycerol-3-phosphate 3-phosphatidyltransferase